MEIITGVERRRRWRGEEKPRILAELDEPGARFNDVARRHDVNRGLSWQWRDAQRRGKLVAETPGFVSLRIASEPPPPEPQGAAPPSSPTSVDPGNGLDDRTEIVLPDSTAVRGAEGISAAALRRVIGALRG